MFVCCFSELFYGLNTRGFGFYFSNLFLFFFFRKSLKLFDILTGLLFVRLLIFVAVFDFVLFFFFLALHLLICFCCFYCYYSRYCFDDVMWCTAVCNVSKFLLYFYHFWTDSWQNSQLKILESLFVSLLLSPSLSLILASHTFDSKQLQLLLLLFLLLLQMLTRHFSYTYLMNNQLCGMNLWNEFYIWWRWWWWW